MYEQLPPIATIRNWDLEIPSSQKKYICTTILNALQNYYVHLPMKEKAFAINPLQEIKLLSQDQFDNGESLNFLRKLQKIILKLNDRHTTLVLPEPWKNVIAFIPILIESYYQDGKTVYIVSKTLNGYSNSELPVGIEITHWNGIEIDRYIEILANTVQGANLDASKKLALANLTIRSLAYTFLPDEDWVVLSCINDKKELRTVSLVWRACYNEPIQANLTAEKKESKTVSLDRNQLNIINFKRDNIIKVALKSKLSDKYVLKELGTILKYGTLKSAYGDVGYLRIFSFEVNDVKTFINQVASILEKLPQDRLIIDIRGNPGGLIPSGQQLVQLLTKKNNSASPVGFRNTTSTRGFGSITDFSQWKKSLDLMEVTGEIFTQYFPLTTFNDMPKYRYPGKSALIIDSLVYSTADFATADFKDNNVGVVIGVDDRTGGGGANVWTYSSLVYYAQSIGNFDIGQLPNGLDLSIAMRRSIRTGVDDGLPVEDLGVEADFVHKMTKNDLLYNNIDLINFTVAQLDK